MATSCEERPCPVCKARQHTLFAHETIDEKGLNPYSYASRKEPEYMCRKLVRCDVCQAVYAPYPPSDGELQEVYSEASYDSSEEATCAAQSYAKLLYKVLDDTPHNLAVDVGAGNGALLPLLLKLGFKTVLGIEPSRNAISSSPKEIQNLIRQEMFTSNTLKGEKASLICSFMTLEHMLNPGSFIKTAFESLEKEGTLALVVHNYHFWINRLLGMKSPIIDIEHLQLFCPRAIQMLLNNAGFNDVRVLPLKNEYPLRYWLRLAPITAAVKGPLLRQAFGKGVFSRLCSLRLSASVGNIMVIGRCKPY